MSNIMRVAGLATGMDLEQIINDLMRVQRMRLESYKQKVTTLEWKQEDYRAINTKLKALRDATFDMRLQRTFLAKKVISSNEAAISATASTNSGEITLDIEVISLATAASKISDQVISKPDGEKIDPLMSFISQRDKFANSHLFDELEGDTFTFSLNGETFTFKVTDTLEYIIATVNANKNVGVTMYYDPYADKVSITSKATGTAGRVAFGDDDGFLQQLLQLSSDEAVGANAKLKINGLVTERASNTFTIDSITITLKDTTPAGSPVRLEVRRDTDAIFEAIKKWVDAYNSTLDELYKELNEQRYPDYKPLTQEEREKLTDRQIEQWEEKARSGLLKNDPTIQSELYKLRSAMYSQVKGITDGFKHLSEIGISTSLAVYGSDNKLIISQDYLSGKLTIKEDELRTAIEANPDKVMDLFTKSSEVWEEKGVAARVYETLGNAIKRLTDIAGTSASLVDNSFVSKQIRTLNEQIELEERRLQMVEDRYWRQFTALEKAINQLNAQSAWLMSQFNMVMGGR